MVSSSVPVKAIFATAGVAAAVASVSSATHLIGTIDHSSSTKSVVASTICTLVAPQTTEAVVPLACCQ